MPAEKNPVGIFFISWIALAPVHRSPASGEAGRRKAASSEAVSVSFPDSIKLNLFSIREYKHNIIPKNGIIRRHSHVISVFLVLHSTYSKNVLIFCTNVPTFYRNVPAFWFIVLTFCKNVATFWYIVPVFWYIVPATGRLILLFC